MMDEVERRPSATRRRSPANMGHPHELFQAEGANGDRLKGPSPGRTSCRRRGPVPRELNGESRIGRGT